MFRKCLALSLLGLSFSFSQITLASEESEREVIGEIAITQLSTDYYLFREMTKISCKDLGLMSTERFDEFVEDIASQTFWSQVKSMLIYTPSVTGGALVGLVGGAAVSPFTGGTSILAGGAAGVAGGVYTANYLASKWDLKVAEKRKIRQALQSGDASLVLGGDQEFLDFTKSLLEDYLEKTIPDSTLL